MNLPMRQVLEWTDFRKKKPPRKTGPCLFTDGVSHYLGWWSESDQDLMVRNADGTNGVIDHSEIEMWAAIPNMVADIREHRAHVAKGV